MLESVNIIFFRKTHKSTIFNFVGNCTVSWRDIPQHHVIDNVAHVHVTNALTIHSVSNSTSRHYCVAENWHHFSKSVSVFVCLFFFLPSSPVLLRSI